MVLVAKLFIADINPSNHEQVLAILGSPKVRRIDKVELMFSVLAVSRVDESIGDE